MANNPNKSDRYPLSTPKYLTSEIEAYLTVTNRYKTRNAAIRALIRMGLDTEYERSPELKRKVQKKLISYCPKD